MERATLSLLPRSPYSFELTAAFATFFRGRYGSDRFENGTYQRLLDLGDHLYLVSVHSRSGTETPRLEAELAGATLHDTSVNRARDQIVRMLSIEQDLSPFYHQAQADPALAPLVGTLRGLHIPQTASVYEALVQAILGQQVSSHVARILRTNLIEKHGPMMENDGAVYYGFPHPDVLLAAGADGLRALGFSARKSQYIIDISEQVVSAQLDLEGLRSQADEEVLQVLTGIRGVGLWTANWLLIRALGRSDGFPHNDLALCRIMGQLFNAGAPLQPEQALEISQRWSPFRSYATAYLFAAMRSGYEFPSA
jgi:DNA-3-methyladenine glycosylase II